jgi:hypothetical protein
MKYQTHNETEVDTNMSHLQGYITADYEELVDAFGSPMRYGFDDYKVDAEWHIAFEDGTVASIYNWKNGRNYMGTQGMDVQDIRHWNVGGYSKIALIHLSNVLNKILIEA